VHERYHSNFKTPAWLLVNIVKYASNDKSTHVYLHAQKLATNIHGAALESTQFFWLMLTVATLITPLQPHVTRFIIIISIIFMYRYNI